MKFEIGDLGHTTKNGRQVFVDPRVPERRNCVGQLRLSVTCSSTLTDEKITKVIYPPLAKLKPLTVTSPSLKRTSTPTKPPKTPSNTKPKTENRKKNKTDSWQLVKETKNAEKAKLLAESRNLKKPSTRCILTKEDFLNDKRKTTKDKDYDGDPLVNVRSSEDYMSLNSKPSPKKS
ncbi:hypothetical protein AVEN_194440-1 [Araneus ventricosus]|uniref:Uncharacterized protein n=1 Tax=Araneus ventricosus TaxID=182803 RepID=A0A4Y2A5R1_ARAVE|nr:hypothetical protein AVEN_194440-1 [Araneus ventricosus]